MAWRRSLTASGWELMDESPCATVSVSPAPSITVTARPYQRSIRQSAPILRLMPANGRLT